MSLSACDFTICILFVDDDPLIREIGSRSLSEAGYRVIFAEDGVEALSLFMEHKDEIDLVMTDMMMPKMDGPTLIQALRAISPDLKIIVSSGTFATLPLPQELNCAVQAVLQKPYSLAALLKTVESVLQT
jgi:two-component system cell cycle sensor histidine kinase/response regulator CckA